jgi:hypothetical protein
MNHRRVADGDGMASHLFVDGWHIDDTKVGPAASDNPPFGSTVSMKGWQ